MINGNLEKRIIDVINDHKKQNDDKGMISRRLTAKKLQVEFKVVFSKDCLFRINSFFLSFISCVILHFCRQYKPG